MEDNNFRELVELSYLFCAQQTKRSSWKHIGKNTFIYFVTARSKPINKKRCIKNNCAPLFSYNISTVLVP